MLPEVVEYDRRGWLALVDKAHRHLFVANALRWDVRNKKKTLVDEAISIDVGDGRLGIGLGAIKVLAKVNHLVSFKQNNVISALPFASFEVPYFDEIEYRQVQLEALQVLSGRDCGIVKIPTGGGKSFVEVAAAYACSKQHNVLILVPKKVVHSEITNAAKTIGVEVKNYADYRRADIAPAGNIFISVPTALYNDSLKNENHEVMDTIGTVIFDECHHLSAMTWMRTLGALRYLTRSFAFSGTPLLEEVNFVGFHQLRVEDAAVYAGAGQIAYIKTAADIGEEIDRPDVYELPFQWSAEDKTMIGGVEEWSNIREAVRRNKNRIDMVSNLIKSMDEINRSTLTCVDELDEGDLILDELDLGKSAICWFGNGKIYCRDRALLKEHFVREQISVGEIRHVIVTSHINEGTNLPDISTVILISGKKGRLAVQRASRVNRLGNQKSAVVNIMDAGVGMLRSQSLSRSESIIGYFGTEAIPVADIEQLRSRLACL